MIYLCIAVLSLCLVSCNKQESPQQAETESAAAEIEEAWTSLNPAETEEIATEDLPDPQEVIFSGAAEGLAPP